MKKQKLDRRKLQHFKEDGLNSPEGIQVYEVSMQVVDATVVGVEHLTASSEHISLYLL